MNNHDIQASALDEFLRLSTYEEKTRWVQKQQGYSEYYMPALCMLARCSAYGLDKVIDRYAMPPLAAWWLDERSESFRKDVIRMAHTEHLLDTEYQQLQFIQQLTIAPVVNTTPNGTKVVNNDSKFRKPYALTASHLATTVKTWLPNLAPKLLHCQSSLWEMTYTYNTGASLETADVYPGIFDYFHNDVAAQGMLVYLGHKPTPTQSPELQLLWQNSWTANDTLPMPWSLYARHEPYRSANYGSRNSKAFCEPITSQ